MVSSHLQLNSQRLTTFELMKKNVALKESELEGLKKVLEDKKAKHKKPNNNIRNHHKNNNKKEKAKTKTNHNNYNKKQTAKTK